jgi:hypothetical protein
MNVEVGNDNRQPGAKPTTSLEPGDDFGGEEVRAYRPDGIVTLDQLDEGSGVELIPRQPSALVFPGFVQVIVEQAKRFGRVVHQVDIGLLIQAAEHLRRVVERVDVANVAGAFRTNGLFDCLRGAEVAGAC